VTKVHRRSRKGIPLKAGPNDPIHARYQHRQPFAKRLHEAVHELLLRVDTLPWDREVASRYGQVRTELSGQGKVLAPLDLQIAAHALSTGSVLVSNDVTFGMVSGLGVEDWTA
jgi:tRNA(fMet)-specific endonuclease VapC